jgi:hypothetical protein
MSVVEAKIQTVEDMHRLIWAAIANKQPISAVYKERYRLLCPHRLGRNRLGQPRVLCYQYGGESKTGLAPIGSPENWRCAFVNSIWPTLILSFGPPQTPIVPRQFPFLVTAAGAEPCAAPLAARLGRSAGGGHQEPALRE